MSNELAGQRICQAGTGEEFGVVKLQRGVGNPQPAMGLVPSMVVHMVTIYGHVLSGGGGSRPH